MTRDRNLQSRLYNNVRTRYCGRHIIIPAVHTYNNNNNSNLFDNPPPQKKNVVNTAKAVNTVIE